MSDSIAPTDLVTIGLAEVRAAAQFLAERATHTPVLRSVELDAIAGSELWLKAEHHQPVGAFKARGALHTVGRLSAGERARGVITYSSGNHGRAVAWAARAYGAPALVTMPTDAPPIKVEAVRALGAEVVFAGTTSEDRRREALRIQAETGAVMIPPFDHPHIIAGQGTATLELCEQVAAGTGGGTLDAVLVPVGGGGVCAGACLATVEQPTAVFSVEPGVCDAMAQSMVRGERVAVEPGPTMADGLKPVRIGVLNFAIAQQHLAGSLRVDEPQIGRALTTLWQHTGEIVEPSGAAALAAALCRLLPGEPRRIGVILSGGNIAADHHERLRAKFPPWPLPA